MHSYFFLALSAIAQTKSDQGPHLTSRSVQFIIRITSAQFLQRGIDRTCVIVYPDRTFHFEHFLQHLVGSGAKRTVSEGLLTPEQSQQLAALLRDPDVSSAGIVPDPGGSLLGLQKRFLDVEVPRDKYRVQEMGGTVIAGRRVDPSFQPVMDFIDAINSSHPSVMKKAKPNYCGKPASKSRRR